PGRAPFRAGRRDRRAGTRARHPRRGPGRSGTGAPHRAHPRGHDPDRPQGRGPAPADELRSGRPPADPGGAPERDGPARRRGRAVTGSAALARLAARAASGKQGEDVLVLDVRELIGITDYFVIASGTSDRQVKTIAEEVERTLREEGSRPVRVEGEAASRWILLDFADFVVHVFHDRERDHYRLERLWIDAPRIGWEDGAAAS